LGPNLVVENCRVVLPRSTRAITISNAQFTGCRFQTNTKFKSFHDWCAAELINCSFFGYYEGNDFGYWEEISLKGKIKGCNFSGAILDGCRFFDCDIDSIAFPLWPCFAILNPHRITHQFEATNWPGELEHWFGGISFSPKNTLAIVGYAPELVKKYGASEDELRIILEQFPEIRL
jgi:hypothetical protein